MKAIGLDNVTIVDNPPIALDIIRKRALTDMQEEPLYICDLTDIIKKHRIWTQFLPRVLPFYGECFCNGFKRKKFEMFMSYYSRQM